MMWSCPNCAEPLVLEKSLWRCANGHSFDQAKQGYVNLLLANQKRSKVPGDNKEMINARRRFLTAGYYQPLVLAISEIIAAEHHQKTGKPLTPKNWLDVGCGEGYYVNELLTLCPEIQWSCLDISKEAVKLAAKGRESHCAVASSYSIPMLDDACDGVLQIFAPASDEEINRVLKPGGLLIRVGPGEDHLNELKQALYHQVAMRKPLEKIEGLKEIVVNPLVYCTEIQSSSLIQDLIMMTPYHWSGDRDAKLVLMDQSVLRITLDFKIQVFKKPQL